MLLDTRAMKRTFARGVRITVVDDDRAYYAATAAAEDYESGRWQFLSTGREALRRASFHRSDLWLISIRLPDMSGFDLCEMLREKINGSAVGLVADRYHREEEVRAHCCGATLYACKSADPGWLGTYLRQLQDCLKMRAPPGEVPECSGIPPPVFPEHRRDT